MARRHHAIAMKPDRQPPPAAACHHTSSAHCASPEDAEKGPHGHQDSADRAEERYRRRLLRWLFGSASRKGHGWWWWWPLRLLHLVSPCAASPSSGVVGSSVGCAGWLAGRSACRSVGRSVCRWDRLSCRLPPPCHRYQAPKWRQPKGTSSGPRGLIRKGKGGGWRAPVDRDRCLAAAAPGTGRLNNKRLIGQRATCRKPISARLEWNGKCMGESAHGK
jgi:hypothetical protein